jgi:hypothetical protein
MIGRVAPALRVRQLFFVLPALACAIAGCGSTRPAPPPTDGATEVVLDSHLPETFRVSRVVAVMDGSVVYQRVGDVAPRQSLFRGKLAKGDHQIRILVELGVPCGSTAEPHETLVVKDSRAFDVGAAGGLVHVDVFGQTPRLAPAERVRLSITLRGIREGRSLYRWSEDGLRTCGRLGRPERARCLAERLVDQSRARRDVVALVCQKDKLDRIVAAENLLPGSEATMRVALEGQIEQLEREAEQCVGEDVAWFGQQETGLDRGGCAGYEHNDDGT